MMHGERPITEDKRCLIRIKTKKINFHNNSKTHSLNLAEFGEKPSN